MTKKYKFIYLIQREIFNEETCEVYADAYPDYWKDAVSFWDDFCKDNLTDNNIKLLKYMRVNKQKYNNCFTAKSIANDLNIKPQSISPMIYNLIKKGYVKKQGANPVQYILIKY